MVWSEKEGSERVGDFMVAGMWGRVEFAGDFIDDEHGSQHVFFVNRTAILIWDGCYR